MSSIASMTFAALLAASAPSAALAAGAAQEEGMVVVRDAQTGKLRAATPAETRALRAQETQLGMAAPVPTPVTVRPDGSLHKHLGERGLVYSVVTREPGGKFGMQCVKGEAAAESALARPGLANPRERSHEDR